jgi:GNAT superfamily N-acetyltransferase
MVLELKPLPPNNLALAEAARTFCLSTIKATYGFEYNPLWHADLDSLLGPAAHNHYAPQNKGCFWVMTDATGDVIGSMGVRSLAWKPNFKPLLADFYPDFTKVASLWRTYLAPQYRGQGRGMTMNNIAREFARAQGYQQIFLECNHAYSRLQAYWQRLGYTHFTSGENFCCFDYKL